MAHGGGGKKKPSLIRSCLTSAIAIFVIVYLVVLLGSAAIKTFWESRFGTTTAVSAAVVQPTAPPANPATLAPTPVMYMVPPQSGSNSTGGAGSGTQAYVPANPSTGPIQVAASSPYYIVEQADLSQNGHYLSFDQSLAIIAAKLLTTAAALKQYNTALGNGTLVAGQVLNVPPDVVSGGGGGNLPPTGRYANP